MGHIDPDRQAWELFKSLPRDQPIHMLNLIRLRPLADYPSDHPDHGKGKSGRQAYADYGRTTAAILKRLKSRIVWSGRPDAVVTGPSDERWDLAFIAEYASAEAFITMVRDPDYREFVKHRTAAVEDSRLIRMAPLPVGEGFGE